MLQLFTQVVQLILQRLDLRFELRVQLFALTPRKIQHRDTADDQAQKECNKASHAGKTLRNPMKLANGNHWFSTK